MPPRALLRQASAHTADPASCAVEIESEGMPRPVQRPVHVGTPCSYSARLGYRRRTSSCFANVATSVDGLYLTASLWIQLVFH